MVKTRGFTALFGNSAGILGYLYPRGKPWFLLLNPPHYFFLDSTTSAKEKGFTVVECKAGLGDHVHCFVSAPPKLSVTQIVKYLKGISGRLLLEEFPELKDHLRQGQLWNRSYFCETIGSSSEENILKYIERQSYCKQ